MFTRTRLNVRITCILPGLFEHHEGLVSQWCHFYNSTWCHQIRWKKISVLCKTMKRSLYWNLKSIQKTFITLDLTSQITLCLHYKYQPVNETQKYTAWAKCSFSAAYQRDSEGKCQITLPSDLEPNKRSCSHKPLLRELFLTAVLQTRVPWWNVTMGYKP
jgi:hypothetical protein